MVPDIVRPPLSADSPARIVKLPVLAPLSIVLEKVIVPSKSSLSVSIVTSPTMNTFPVKATSVSATAFEVTISPLRVIPSAAVKSIVAI